MHSLYIAIDLGAGSGRVFIAGPDPKQFLLQEIRRFHYPPFESDGHLRWDFSKIFGEIKEGLRDAATRAGELQRPVRSIGVDSWGVDYGLIDAAGELIESPICYRDSRTRDVMQQVFLRVSREEIFQRTGIQFLPFNTLFQVMAHTREGFPPAAQTQLLIPDLINFMLTGKRICEYTNATTTQMLNAHTGEWDVELLGRLGLTIDLLPPIVAAGSEVGLLRADLAKELGLDIVPVVAPATHDTGSAVAGAPIKFGCAYISSGTWSLVGVERNEALINDEVARQNFTNEGGAFGTTRFLKNVMGLWILESCRKEWQRDGVVVDYDALLRDVEAIDSCPALIYPDDERFLSPPSMLAAIANQLKETNQTMPDTSSSMAKMILDSLAFRYASVLRTIERLTHERIKGVRIIGGGSQNRYLNQMTANATGLPVTAGPVEATVIGNVLVQAITAGRFGSLSEAREYVAENVPSQDFFPQTDSDLESATAHFHKIEKQFIERS
jgi:rhamnulokinase